MQKVISPIQFNAEEVLFGTDIEMSEFHLSSGFSLIALFHPNASQSALVVIQNNISSADLLKKIRSIKAENELNKCNFKILMAQNVSQKNNLADWIEALKRAGLLVSGSAAREGMVSGILSFKESRIRVEKVADKIRLLIVDDSKTIRDLLTSVFSTDPQIEVVGTADHPDKVEHMIQALKPNVITLDIHMPGMDGVTLLKQYLPKYRIPTVMISSISMSEGPYVLNALEAGAVDYIQKPSFTELNQVAPLFIEKIKAAAKSNIKLQEQSKHKIRLEEVSLKSNALIIIGSSTGGTEALKQVFSQMPAQIPPVVVVQHIPAVFSKAFADRLNQLCPFKVKEAEDGDTVVPNQVLIAPGGFQMGLVKSNGALVVKIKDDAPVNRHKPSVDYLFDSVLPVIEGREVVATILTGMGADGARALKRLRDAGARTIAQDEATSIVYGMPREAARLGGAEHVLPLGSVAAKLIELCAVKVRKISA